jgi:hypothetical protein
MWWLVIKCYLVFRSWRLFVFFSLYSLSRMREAQLVAKLLLPQVCHHQEQMVFGILKCKFRLPLPHSLSFDIHSVKTDRKRMVSLLFNCLHLFFLSLGLLATKWNFPVSHTRSLWGLRRRKGTSWTFNCLCAIMWKLVIRITMVLCGNNLMS